MIPNATKTLYIWYITNSKVGVIEMATHYKRSKLKKLGLGHFHVALLKVYTMNGNSAGAASERKALNEMDLDYQAAKNFAS